MWSLAIEEQYYLVWPLIVGFALRNWDRRRYLGCLALAAGSAPLAIRALHAAQRPSRVYYGTDTRVQALAIGSVLGALMTNRAASTDAQVRNVAGWIGLIGSLVVAFASTTSDIRVYQGGLTVVAVLSALLVLGTTGTSGPLLVAGFRCGRCGGSA